MSTITITFSDNPDGTVAAAITPTVEFLLAKWKADKRSLTAAEGYAIRAINSARETHDTFTREGEQRRDLARIKVPNSVIKRKFRNG